MPHQLAYRYGPLFLRKPGHILLDVVIQLQLILLQQHAGRGRGQRRRRRADPEPHAWRDGHALVEIRPAKAFGPDDIAVRTDGDRKSRKVLVAESRTRNLPSASDRGRPLSRWRALCHGWRVLRVWMVGLRGHTHVPPHPQDRGDDEANGHDAERQPGFYSTPWHRIDFTMQSYLRRSRGQVDASERVRSVTLPAKASKGSETQRQVEPRKSRRHDRCRKQEPLRRRRADVERLIERRDVAGIEQVIHVDADIGAAAAEP